MDGEDGDRSPTKGSIELEEDEEDINERLQSKIKSLGSGRLTFASKLAGSNAVDNLSPQGRGLMKSPEAIKGFDPREEEYVNSPGEEPVIMENKYGTESQLSSQHNIGVNIPRSPKDGQKSKRRALDKSDEMHNLKSHRTDQQEEQTRPSKTSLNSKPALLRPKTQTQTKKARNMLRDNKESFSKTQKHMKKEEIAHLYESKEKSLADFRLPRLAEYFKELNTENMCYTLADRVSREELWMIAKERLLEDRRRLQEKLEMESCSFRPQINPETKRQKRGVIGGPHLRSVAIIVTQFKRVEAKRTAHQRSHENSEEQLRSSIVGSSAKKRTLRSESASKRTYEELYERSKLYSSNKSNYKY